MTLESCQYTQRVLQLMFKERNERARKWQSDRLRVSRVNDMDDHGFE